VCFGLLAPVAALLGRRVGNEMALGAALLCLLVGIAARSAGGSAMLVLGTVLVGSGVALGNVLVPSLVKRDLSAMAGLAMALYTTCLTGGAAIASVGTAALAANGWGWRSVLLLAAVPALAALAVFGTWAVRRHRRRGYDEPAVVVGQVTAVWRSATAWQLSLFLAGQSFLFYSVLAWLPVLLQERGVGVAWSGMMLSTYNLLGIAGALLVPGLLRRGPDQRGVASAAMACWLTGLLGLWLVPDWYPLWSVFLGLTQGAGITIALTLVVLRARDAMAARELSGMVQTTGYLLAASGPFLVGALRDWSGSWGPSFGAMLAMGALSLLAARGAGRNSVVG